MQVSNTENPATAYSTKAPLILQPPHAQTEAPRQQLIAHTLLHAGCDGLMWLAG